jgi:DNA-binding beta-propeller fold protein YncE
VKVASKVDPFPLIQDAYDYVSVNNLNGDTILSRDVVIDGDLYIDQPISVTLEGGYDPAFSMVTGETVINGNLTVSDGTLTISDIVLAPIGPPTLVSTFGRGSFNTEGELNFPSGVTVDSLGNVYVCTDNNPSITKFDSNGNVITRWFVNDCLGLDTDSQNNIFIASKTGHKIVKYDSNGNLLLEWGTRGTGQGQFERPNDVDVNKTTGLVYVADSENFRIQVFDTNGNYQFEWGSQGSGDGQFLATRGPLGLAVDEITGWVYVADSDAHRIQKFGSDGTFLMKWGVHGMGEGQFLWARNVEVDSSGLVYVVDGDMERVQIFDNTGNLVLVIKGVPNNDPVTNPCFSHLGHIDCYAVHNTIDGPFHPRDIAVDSQFGFIYVAATYAQGIDKFDLSGNFIDSWGYYEKSNGVFNRPRGLAIDTTRGFLYVADSNNFLIQKFDLNENFVTSWGHSGRVSTIFDGGDRSFDFPQTVGVDDEGNVYVLRIDATYSFSIGHPVAKRVQKFDQNGNWLLSWNYNDPAYDQLHTHFLQGVIYNPVNNYIYISNKRAIYGQYKLIQYFDKNGNFIGDFGPEGSANGELKVPGKLAVDPNNGDIYVVDTWNSRIQKFSKDGVFLDTWGSYGSADNQFIVNVDSGIYADARGYVYLSDSGNHKIKVFNSNGSVITSFTNFWPAGLVVDGSGYIYVIDGNSEKINKYSPIP